MLWECENTVTLTHTSMVEIQILCIIKLNMHIPYGLAIPLLGTIPREMKTFFHANICVQTFITAWFMRQRDCGVSLQWNTIR